MDTPSSAGIGKRRPAAGMILRRFGPVLFWQFAWLALVSLPVTALAVRLSSGESYVLWWSAMGLIVLAGCSYFGLLRRLVSLLVREPVDESETKDLPERRLRVGRLAIDPDLASPFLLQGWLGLLASVQGVQIAEDWGFDFGMRVFLVYWAILLTGVWIWWALTGRRPAPEALPPPVLPGTDLVDARVVPNDRADDAVTVSVSARKAASTEKVVYSVVLLQIVPAISGGERRWTVRIDGEPVAVVTQTWEHPRWWPPIEWTAEPDTPFTAATVSFSPA